MPAPDALAPAARPSRLRLHASQLPAGLRAAGELLLQAMPARWRQRIVRPGKALYLAIADGQLALRAVAGGREEDLGVLPADPDTLAALRARLDAQPGATPRWLLLDARQVLRRVLSLPAAAESRLREVLRHEIDRQTPFAADEVVFEARVLARDPVQKQVQVELLVVPSARLAAALAQLGPLSGGLAGVDVAADGGDRFGVNLLPEAQRPRHGARGRWLNRGLAAAAVLLVWSAMLQVLDNRREALAQLQSRIGQAESQVREVRKLGDALRTSQQAMVFLGRARARQPTVVELLADLTRRIPDTTSLEKLALNQGKIVMIGQSQEAPALVGLLQGSPVLRTPALAGAVQRDARTGRDRFTLVADLAGGDDPEARNGRPR